MLGKTNPLPRQLIQHRSAYRILTVAAQISITKIVSNHKNHIRLPKRKPNKEQKQKTNTHPE